MIFLRNGSSFYEALVKGGKNATSRIIMSSLYWGSGSKEALLFHLIRCRAVRTHIYLDKNRYYSSDNSIFYTQDCHEDIIRLMSTTRNRTWLPFWISEILGVYHSKYFMFDDVLIIAGANVSKEYFGSRIDQYIVLSGDTKFRNTLKGTCIMQRVPPQLLRSGIIKSPYFHSTLAQNEVLTTGYSSNGFSYGSFWKKLIPFIYQQSHSNIDYHDDVVHSRQMSVSHLQKGIFHSKGFLNGNYFIAGSSNFNIRSSERDTESILVMHNPSRKVQLSFFNVLH
jgi:phosphatidylserine/phosphatidylglycerophosphate/cardiolipin synthase-like enzyme